MNSDYSDDKQRKRLVKLGIEIPPLLTKKEADKLIKENKERRMKC